MTFHETSRQTTAAADRVWRIWADPAHWPEWNPDVAEMTLDGPFATGGTATMRTRAGRTHRMRIAEVTAPTRFVLETRAAPGMHLRFRCTVEPATGGARIAQGVEMSGPIGSLVAARAAPKIAQGFAPILAALAAKAEETPQ